MTMTYRLNDSLGLAKHWRLRGATNELDVSKNGDEWGTLPRKSPSNGKTRGFPYFPLIFRQIQLRGP